MLNHLMIRVKSKDHIIGTYQINKISLSSLSCFNDKVNILNNGYNELALGC